MKTLFQNWLSVMRLWSLTASTIPVAAGAALAALDGKFSWLMLALTMASGWLLHIAVNLLNTYGDYVSGVDSEGADGGAPHLVRGILKPGAVFGTGIGALVIAAGLGLAAAALSDWRLLWFAVAGVIGAGCYTTGLRYKYLGLGVLVVFFQMGVLMVGASYFAQACTLTWSALVVSLPVSCLVAAILLGNDLRDMASDREAKIKTTALFLGARGARGLFYALHLLPHACVIGAVAAGTLPRWCLLTLLAAPLTFSVIKATRDGFKTNDTAKISTLVVTTAKTHFIFGLLLTLGIEVKALG
jgi:1,4-dihydroxy-2-naphthoate octaprenyltransferase